MTDRKQKDSREKGACTGNHVGNHAVLTNVAAAQALQYFDRKLLLGRSPIPEN
jgi:hypothetical protein